MIMKEKVEKEGEEARHLNQIQEAKKDREKHNIASIFGARRHSDCFLLFHLFIHWSHFMMYPQSPPLFLFDLFPPCMASTSMGFQPTSTTSPRSFLSFLHRASLFSPGLPKPPLLLRWSNETKLALKLLTLFRSSGTVLVLEWLGSFFTLHLVQKWSEDFPRSDKLILANDCEK